MRNCKCEASWGEQLADGHYTVVRVRLDCLPSGCVARILALYLVNKGSNGISDTSVDYNWSEPLIILYRGILISRYFDDSFFRYNVTSDLATNFSWSFQQLSVEDDDLTLYTNRLADMAKIYVISVTNTEIGGADHCKTCPKGIIEDRYGVPMNVLNINPVNWALQIRTQNPSLSDCFPPLLSFSSIACVAVFYWQISGLTGSKF